MLLKYQRRNGNRRSRGAHSSRRRKRNNEDWVVLCEALYQSIGEDVSIEVHEKWKEACKAIGLKKSGTEGGRSGQGCLVQDAKRAIFS